MNYVEAVIIIKQMFINSASRDPISDRSIALLRAVEALEKQISIKPNNKSLSEGSCPYCGGDVTSVNQYCFRCSQALDWSNDDGVN